MTDHFVDFQKQQKRSHLFAFQILQENNKVDESRLQKLLQFVYQRMNTDIIVKAIHTHYGYERWSQGSFDEEVFAEFCTTVRFVLHAIEKKPALPEEPHSQWCCDQMRRKEM